MAQGPTQESIANAEKARVMLEEHLEQAKAEVNRNVEESGLGLTALTRAMQNFAMQSSALAMPKDVQCQQGCAFCCHTRATTSIAEVLVIADQLRQAMPPKVFEGLSAGIAALVESGTPTSLEWWLKSRTPCPFLLTSGGQLCAIYDIRPFTCRSQHSTDVETCREGFELGRAVDVPCYPLLRRGLDIFTSAFIATMRERGLPSYPVGFIAAMNVALSHDDAVKRWLGGEDLFRVAEVEG